MLDAAAWTRLLDRNTAMCLAAGRVIEERLAHAAAWHRAPNRRNGRELHGMVLEKGWAAGESAMAISVALAELHGRLAWLSWRAWTGGMGSSPFGPLAVGFGAHGRATRRIVAAGLPHILAAGLGPIARRVHANDRRLARGRARRSAQR